MTTRSQKMAVCLFVLAVISGCTNEQPVESTAKEVQPDQPVEMAPSNSQTQQKCSFNSGAGQSGDH